MNVIYKNVGLIKRVVSHLEGRDFRNSGATSSYRQTLNAVTPRGPPNPPTRTLPKHLSLAFDACVDHEVRSYISRIRSPIGITKLMVSSPYWTPAVQIY